MADGSDPKRDQDGEHEAALDALAARFHADAPVETPHAAPAPAPAALDDEPSADELRSGALARRLAQRRGYSITAREPKAKRLLSSWGLGGVMLLSLWSLWGTFPDLRYWLSSAPPIALGHLGGYHLEAAQDGGFARVEGMASPQRGSYSRMFSEHELIPLIASRILVDRDAPPDDAMRGYAFRYSGEGRLVRAAEGGKWDGVREQFVAHGELARTGDVWLLEEGVSPRKGWRIPLESGSWALLVLVCAALLISRALKAGKPPAAAAADERFQ